MSEQDKGIQDAVCDLIGVTEANGRAEIVVTIEGGKILSQVGGHSFLADDNGTEATMIASAWVAGILEEGKNKDVDFTVQLTKDEKDHSIINIIHTPKHLIH